MNASMTNLILLPTPRSIQYLPGNLRLTGDKLIHLSGASPQTLFAAARRFQQALLARVGLAWQTTAGAGMPDAQIGIKIELGGVLPADGYHLSITGQDIRVEASDPAGAFYAICTLNQVMEQCGPILPCLDVTDWPDFAARGVMLDISRDRVPTMDTLYMLVDMLASWKINQFQLYTEHTFAYRRHPQVWAQASPITGEEILLLDAYCRERFIELVPNQNSFGHMHRWLVHPGYAHLAETHERFLAPWGDYMNGPFSLCPLDPGSLRLMEELYDELLPHFSSRMFNVGCDETFDLGAGRSKAACKERGSTRVYLDFLLQIQQAVSRRGFTMQFWGDIILHAPELIAELPREVIALDWGYEANHPFDQQGAQFKQAGIPFYVCPGTSSWNSVAGRTDNALGNLQNAAENGLKHGAIGYLNTDWGDNGHWQPLPISFIGFAAGAAYAWTVEASQTLDMARASSLYAFGDPSGALGQAAFDLGNVYRTAGIEPINMSALFGVLQMPLQDMRADQRLPSAAAFDQASAAIEQATSRLARASSNRADANWLVRELVFVADMLRHACMRGCYLHQSAPITPESLQQDARRLAAEHREVWLLRSRPGGLNDSIARLEQMSTES